MSYPSSSLVHVHLVLLLDCVDNWMHMTVMALCDHHLLSLAKLALVVGESSPSEFVGREGETTLENLADFLQICLGVTAGCLDVVFFVQPLFSLLPYFMDVLLHL
jgi:hypothetical protein